MAEETFDLYSSMQNLNRSAIKYAADTIEIGMSLSDIKELLENYLLENGADSFWYWDVGAFIFAGDETALSASGKDYKVADRVIQRNDIITIDLSPQRNDIWGDYARTLVFEDGVLCDEIEKIKKEEWRKGLQMEEYLHQTLIDVGTPDMTFEELYDYMNELIVKKGFLNLDFLGNLGHSIEKNKNDRIYTEKGNQKRLSDVTMFTFEPHISIPTSRYGYKKEDIHVELNSGYVTIQASTSQSNDVKDESTGNYIRRERYSGSCSRSFYVGDEIREEDIRARYENGVLSLTVPKREAKQIEAEQKKYIAIEG